jgi:hypothetical protein
VAGAQRARAAPPPREGAPFAGAAAAGASAVAFHAPHAEQRPNQRASSWPQWVQ